MQQPHLSQSQFSFTYQNCPDGHRGAHNSDMFPQTKLEQQREARCIMHGLILSLQNAEPRPMLNSNLASSHELQACREVRTA